jgi:hypothetical protein
VPAEDADHIALGKYSQNALRGVRDDDRSNAFRSKKLYDFPQGAMGLCSENVAPLIGENARNCHSSLPFSGGLSSAARKRKMRRE